MVVSAGLVVVSAGLVVVSAGLVAAADCDASAGNFVGNNELSVDGASGGLHWHHYHLHHYTCTTNTSQLLVQVQHHWIRDHKVLPSHSCLNEQCARVRCSAGARCPWAWH